MLIVAMLLGMSIMSHAAEVTIGLPGDKLGEEIGAKLYRFFATEDNIDVIARGETREILAIDFTDYDHGKYEFFNDMEHPISSLVLKDSYSLTGNTSSDTKLILDNYHTKWGFFDSFQLQVGEDEKAEELTVSCKLGAWRYYLKNKESGEIFSVSGDDRGELLTRKIKVKDERDSFSFTRTLMADKGNVNLGEKLAIRLKYEMGYNEEKYTLYGDKDNAWWDLGISSCTVSGNTCEKTKIEFSEEYANTYYLFVDEEEKAEELTVEMVCGEWQYYVKDKVTDEVIRINGGKDGQEILTMAIKVGDSNSAASESTATSSASDDNSQQLPENIWANEVTASNGTKTVSTIGGVYQTTNVAGVAIVTPKEQVEAAAGINTAEKNANVRFYIYNGPHTDAKKALEQAAVQGGKKVNTIISVDMYVISKEGKVDKVANTADKIRIVIGLPSQYRNTNKTYAIGMAGEDGKLQLFEDLDSDPATITIETNRFGVMALIE